MNIAFFTANSVFPIVTSVAIDNPRVVLTLESHLPCIQGVIFCYGNDFLNFTILYSPQVHYGIIIVCPEYPVFGAAFFIAIDDRSRVRLGNFFGIAKPPPKTKSVSQYSLVDISHVGLSQ